MRMQLLFLAGFLALSFLGEKCRELVGEEERSRSRRERFTFTNCFDMSYGSTACLLKEVIKFYFYYIRAIYVHKVKSDAAKRALEESLSSRQDFDLAVVDAAAREEGKAAARRASRQVKHVMGPMLSSGWDLFETMYVGGSAAEGIVRSGGTFVGAYGGGIAGEGKCGWLGFVAGSQLGSWIGGRMGLMVYDVWNCMRYMIHCIYL